MMTRPVVAADVGGTNTRMALVDRARILKRIEFPTKDFPRRDQLLNRLLEAIEEIAGVNVHQRPRANAQVPLVLGLPGLIDAQRGLIYQLPNIEGWDNVPIRRLIERRSARRVYVDNDVNLMALAEHRFGAGRGVKHLICLTLGTGVGGALILNGELYRGAHGAAGEVGHMPLHVTGDRCACGGFGCLERSVGNRSLMERIDQQINRTKQGLLYRWVYQEGRTLSPELIDEAVRAGDQGAERFWRQVGEELGTTLTGLANLLDLERIIIGGGIAKAGEVLFGAIRSMIQRRAMRVQRQVKVVPAQLGTDAGLVGAWCLVHATRCM